MACIRDFRSPSDFSCFSINKRPQRGLLLIEKRSFLYVRRQLLMVRKCIVKFLGYCLDFGEIRLLLGRNAPPIGGLSFVVFQIAQDGLELGVAYPGGVALRNRDQGSGIRDQ